MPKKYKKPPVIEAVCQFSFASSRAWDWTIPGLVYEKIQDEFPDKQQVNVLEMKLDMQQNRVTEQNQVKMQFSPKDNSAVVGVAPDSLTVSFLPPYAGWKKFKKTIIQQLKIYKDAATPDSITRLGLRYINKIDIPSESIELEEYFRIMPQIPQPVPQLFSTFVIQIEIPHVEMDAVLRLVFVKVHSTEPSTQSFVLDLDMFTSFNTIPSAEDIEIWLNKAHNSIESTFLAAFTEKTHKEIFEEVSS